MFLRRLSWAQLTKVGLPLLFVLRPLAGGFTPANVGDEFNVENTSDKKEMMRTRQLYEQKRIGTLEELELMLAKDSKLDPELKAALELRLDDSPVYDEVDDTGDNDGRSDS